MISRDLTLYDNHRQDGWLISAIVVTLLESLFFGARVYCRWVAKAGWGSDDFLCAAGYVFCLALNAVGMAITTRTWVGQHTSDVAAVDIESAILFLRLQIPLAITYLLAAIVPKIAIVALFLRVFIQRPFRIACWVVQTFLVLYLIAGVASILASCHPFSAQFQLPGTLGPGERCINLKEQYQAGSYANIITDLAIIILPIPVVWQIQNKSIRDKIGLLCTFCLGLIGLGFSIARLAAFFNVFDEYDILWTAAYTGIFTTIEPASYFLVACMMTFRQLLRMPCCGQRSRHSEASANGALTLVPSSGQGSEKIRGVWRVRSASTSASGRNESV